MRHQLAPEPLLDVWIPTQGPEEVGQKRRGGIVTSDQDTLCVAYDFSIRHLTLMVKFDQIVNRLLMVNVFLRPFQLLSGKLPQALRDFSV